MTAEVEDHPTTRELVLAEALRCFADQGYDGTSLNDIAAGVGIRRPSLLHHFGSKEQLYREVFDLMLGDWFERLEAAVATAEQGLDKVDHVIAAGFDFFVDNPDYVRLVRREALDSGARLGIDLASVLRPLWDRAVQYFRREIAAGSIRPHDPEQFLLSGYGAILSYFSDAPLMGGLLDDDPLGPAALRRRRDHLREFYRVALAP